MATSILKVLATASFWSTVCAVALSTPNVDFVMPPLLTNTPQTANQTAFGSQHGRRPGPLEFFQPPLDSTLSNYTPLSYGLSGNFVFAASDVLAVLSNSFAAEFMKIYPNVNISIPPPYAGSLGALELINGTLDGVFVSRELKPTDLSSFTAAFGYGPLSIPIGGGSYKQFGFLDGLAFIVNKENPVESLTFEQLDSIFSTTRHLGGRPITHWRDLGVRTEFGDKEIKLYGIQPWNGFEEFVRERVLSINGLRGEWRSGNITDTAYDDAVHWETTVFKNAGLVANDSAAIGYTGFAYIDQPVKILSLAKNSSSPAVAGSYENVAKATYPLSRVFYFNMNKIPGLPINPVLAEFLKFILSQQGQKLILDQGIFLPLRQFQQQTSFDLLALAP